MSTRAKKESKITRCMKAPIRVLIRARDFYIRSLSGCAGRVSYGTVIGGPAPIVNSTLPKSFSVHSTSSNDEDFRELMRIASTRSLGNKIELELRRRQSPIAGVNAVPRSHSAAVGRIDEDKPCEFGEEINVKKTNAYPRSRSYAVSKTTGMLQVK
ncbi:unnamed protein product [Ilex paraguariensis]|uniref:Uncharacterized protein n=1 Tax=Ilex paraguariensis TaxID=185542 RepID=A0ABC8SED3_9AQUA